MDGERVTGADHYSEPILYHGARGYPNIITGLDTIKRLRPPNLTAYVGHRAKDRSHHIIILPSSPHELFPRPFAVLRG